MENAGDFLTLEAPITTAADDIFFSCEDFIYLKNKKKNMTKFECHLLQILLGTLRVKEEYLMIILGYFFLFLHKNICFVYSLEGKLHLMCTRT